MSEERTGNPGTAAVLSFIFSGLGQIYNGQIYKGLVIIFFSAISMLFLVIGSVLIGFWLLGRVTFSQEVVVGIALFIIGIIGVCILGIYSIFDSYNVASKR